MAEICVENSLRGLLALNKDIILVKDYNVVLRNDENFHLNPKNVFIVTGGGSGHEPGPVGFVGQGLLSASVCGNIFTSPSVKRFV